MLPLPFPLPFPAAISTAAATSIGIAQYTIRTRRNGLLTVEASIEVAIESSDVGVSVVASIADSDVSQPIEITVEGADVAVAIVGGAVAVAIQRTEIVVAAGRA